jgi:thioredoxin reductase (NADPH)
VLITDKKYEHEVEFLSGVANKLYLLATYNDCSVSGENITRLNSIPVGVKGRMRLEQVVLKDGEIAVDGLFVLRDSVSPKTLLSGLEIKDGKIVVDRDMKTSVKGVFACGDCTGAPYQYAKAVGEGNVALHSAIKYLATAKD